MKKSFFLISLITWLISCNEHIVINEKIVESVTFRGWFDYSIINFTDGSYIQRAPGWINDVKLKRGDTISTFLTSEDWPDTLLLRPINREDILDYETKEPLCFIVAYEDNLGLIIRKRNYKTIKNIASEIKLCRSYYEYGECGN